MGSFGHLLIIASMPVLKMLIITAIGLFLALNRVNILGETARHHLNEVVYYVFGPALVGSNLAKTVTLKSFLALWFMPVNILITFMFGSVLGWLLAKLTRAPKDIKGLTIASCSAGNLGILPLIIVPALCKEKGSPFGAPDVCQTYGLSYASLSMAIGSIYMWVYTYNILRIYSKDQIQVVEAINEEPNRDTLVNNAEAGEPRIETSVNISAQPLSNSSTKSVNACSFRIKQWLRTTSKEINVKEILTPTTNGALLGFFIGMIPPFQKLLFGNHAPLHVIGDSALMIGDASIPLSILILGANLLKGLKRSGIQLTVVVGIIAVRYIFLPLLGILVVKGAVRAGLVHSHDPLFQFMLLLQHAVPPSVGIGTMTQLFGVGQTECSVITLCTYTLASVALTLWSTVFLWLVAS